MIKQRHSSSVLSSKTLSRSKYINRTSQQKNNDVSIDSGKDARTLRHNKKNKYCLIPRQLVQSTQSHLIYSNQSNRYKSNKLNQSQDIKQNREDMNKKREQDISRTHYNMNSGINMVQSKLTQPQNNYRSSPLVHPELVYSYKPFISLPGQEMNHKANILSKLSILTDNMKPQTQVNKSVIQNESKNGNFMMKEKILQRQVKEMFQYKSMQLTKALQEMHRFYISVNELKWICQEVHFLIKKYNHQIEEIFHESLSKNNKKRDLHNMQKEAEELLKRFNQLQIIKNSTGPFFNFNLLANNTFSASSFNQNQVNKKINKLVPMTDNHQFLNRHTDMNESIQNQNSWSKLIQNIQQQNDVISKHYPNPQNNIHHSQPHNHDQNKNITIRTFQVTETNSPFKNKTLNELIRLSELRKTQFLSNYQSSDKQNNPNQHNIPHQNKDNLVCGQNLGCQNFKQNSINKKRFIKKGALQQAKIRQISPQKDPFDSIHLPHFNVKPQTQFIQQQISLQDQSQRYYTLEIERLKKLLQIATQQNNQYHRKMGVKNQQLLDQNESFKKQLKKHQQKYLSFEKSVYRLVEDALNQLVNCAMLSNISNQPTKKTSYSMGSLDSIGRTQPFSKSEPSIMIGNKSFFQIVNCLQLVFKLNQSQQNSMKPSYQSKMKQNKSQILKKDSHNQNQSIKNKNTLIEEIQELTNLRNNLQKQIIRHQKRLNQLSNKCQVYPSQSYQQLTQIIFAQAFTIQDMLQMEDEES